MNKFVAPILWLCLVACASDPKDNLPEPPSAVSVFWAVIEGGNNLSLDTFEDYTHLSQLPIQGSVFNAVWSGEDFHPSQVQPVLPSNNNWRKSTLKRHRIDPSWLTLKDPISFYGARKPYCLTRICGSDVTSLQLLDDSIGVFLSNHCSSGNGIIIISGVGGDGVYHPSKTLVMWPGQVRSQASISQIITQADVLATVCDYIGANSAAGQSKRALLEGRDSLATYPAVRIIGGGKAVILDNSHIIYSHNWAVHELDASGQICPRNIAAARQDLITRAKDALKLYSGTSLSHD